MSQQTNSRESFHILLILLFIFQPMVLADENQGFQQYQKKLERLHQSINKVKKHLKTTRYKRSNVITDLKQLESDISKNTRALNKTEARIKKLNKEMSTLRRELDQLQTRLGSQQQQLAEQARAAYAIGHQQQIKMLLNQQDPAEMGRVMVYFDYLNRAREQQISDFLEGIAEKQRLDQQLGEALDEHKQSLAKRKKQKHSLYSQRLKRNRLLARLEKQINDQEQSLAGLEQSRHRIENLLMSLGELLADIPQSPSDKRPFKQQKGKLPWPASGPFLATYGEPRNQGDLKWKGVLIGAAHGSPVRAISRGRVAFADWLQGFGFIAIIDHGEGYMSLYGHNESLFKQAGDWVDSGEVIATIGDSGGQPLPGVYFEIRSRGKPINPKNWCSRKVKHTTSLQ